MIVSTRTTEATSAEDDDDRAARLRGRLWRYGPIVAWSLVIFFASTDSMSASNTSRIIRPLLLWLDPTMSEDKIEFAHIVVRKASHFTEYAVLALLAARAFITSSRHVVRSRWAIAAFLLVALCSSLDELAQSFVP